ncbi:MAG: type II toxin-antitoxin system VapC family toxin [Pseudonocardia sp.]|nr:type II toxin-antitoxin system VapC family toxin [Pseudonocardia sp.]
MIDKVIDASALVLALGGKDAASAALRDTFPGTRRHAPHLIDAEVGSVLRSHEQAGLLSPAEAGSALKAGRMLVDHRYPHAGPPADLAWTLRHTVTFYDALYVALAVRLALPLVTADARLARAPGVTCAVELV